MYRWKFLICIWLDSDFTFEKLFLEETTQKYSIL